MTKRKKTAKLGNSAGKREEFEKFGIDKNDQPSPHDPKTRRKTLRNKGKKSKEIAKAKKSQKQLPEEIAVILDDFIEDSSSTSEEMIAWLDEIAELVDDIVDGAVKQGEDVEEFLERLEELEEDEEGDGWDDDEE